MKPGKSNITNMSNYKTPIMKARYKLLFMTQSLPKDYKIDE